jgi:hypothetical protein
MKVEATVTPSVGPFWRWQVVLRDEDLHVLDSSLWIIPRSQRGATRRARLCAEHLLHRQLRARAVQDAAIEFTVSAADLETQT